MIVKTYKEPTDVFICGIDFEKKPETFGLTDDYSSIFVQGATNKQAHMDIIGYVFIISRAEAKEMIDALDIYDTDDCWMLLKDYVGDIKIHFEDSEYNVFPIEGADLSEYLSDIFPGEGWYDTVVDINCPTTEVYRGSESLLKELSK